MHRHETRHQRQADAEAGLRARLAARHLCEQVEDRPQLVGRDADPGVGDGDHDVTALAFGGEHDVPPAFVELARVDQEVAEHLYQAHRVGFQPDRFCGPGKLERQSGGLHQRSGHLRRLVHRCRQLHGFAVELQLAARDAGNVQQVVHEVDEMAELALHGFLRHPEDLGVTVRVLDELQHVGERRQRITELVREHGEELVLAAIAFVHGFDVPQPLQRGSRVSRQRPEELLLVGRKRVLAAACEAQRAEPCLARMQRIAGAGPDPGRAERRRVRIVRLLQVRKLHRPGCRRRGRVAGLQQRIERLPGQSCDGRHQGCGARTIERERKGAVNGQRLPHQLPQTLNELLRVRRFQQVLRGLAEEPEQAFRAPPRLGVLPDALCMPHGVFQALGRE